MNIIVCIKQVPSTSNVKVDPVNGTLIRDGISSKMNPYDLNALELGLQLIEKNGGSLKVVSMGPPVALEVIREAIYMGANGGFLISDRKFGGADVLATSFTLGSGIKAAGAYDLIICGKQTTDGDTAQVGAELAEHLGIPHCTNVRSAEVKGNKLTFVSNLDNRVVTAEIGFPCLLCTDSEINTPRLPSYKRRIEFGDCKDIIQTITFNDVDDKDESHYGLKGSATQVERIFEPDKKEDRKMIKDGDLVLETFNILKTKKFI